MSDHDPEVTEDVLKDMWMIDALIEKLSGEPSSLVVPIVWGIAIGHALRISARWEEDAADD